MIWNKEKECMPREEMNKLQLARLKKTVVTIYQKVPYYREKMQALGVVPEDIQSLSDIAKLPMTTKEDLRLNFPYGLFAAPMKDIVRIHASSGTTGKPTVVGYTKNDLDNWSEMIARLVYAAGGSHEDIAQIAFGYGLFTGAFGLHYGLEKVGAAVIPTSSGNTERQITIMKDFGTTLLVSTPSYALYIAEVMEKMGIKKEELKLRVGMFGAEASSPELRAEVERRLGLVATENYGLSEVTGPGVSGECLYKTGLHINEDLFYCEIVDPVTGEPLPEGAHGELVITPLLKEGIPLLRYRTHDLTSFIDGTCPCGRTLRRMARVSGRSDDMLIIRGVNVFPLQIEEVLNAIPGIGLHYEIVMSRQGALDKMEILVEVTDGTLLEKFEALEKLQQQIRHRLRVNLSVDADVRLVEPFSLKRFEGKARRVTDLRK